MLAVGWGAAAAAQGADYLVTEGKLSTTDFYRLVSCRAAPGGETRQLTMMFADVVGFTKISERMGTAVIVIEHHQAVMAHADWIIDIGPGAGHDGGTIVFEGPPSDLAAARSTLTGEHLAAYVGR